MKKRIAGAFLALVMILSLLPVSALAADGERAAIPADRMSTQTVNGVTAQVKDGAVDYTVSRTDTSDWAQDSGVGSVQAYTYVGLYITAPEGAVSLKFNDEGNPDAMKVPDEGSFTGGKFQQWFPIAYEKGDDYGLFYGGRTYEMLLDWYDEDNQLISSEYVNVTRSLADCLAVAQVGDYTYETLADAVDAAQDNDTVELLKTTEGSGVKVLGNGRHITIDLNGFTYTVKDPTVGSTGTETNAFQLLKGTDVTFKNGTIKPGTASAKILFQNYCNLTLDNVTVDCSGMPTCQYACSNNCGDVLIKDSTILAAPGQNAFDPYYWPSNGYAEGVSVTVEGDSQISGNIEYGSDGSATGKAEIADKAVLTIKGGTFTGEISTYNLGASVEPNITVTGGSFTEDVSDYVAPGMTWDPETGNIVIDEENAVASVDGMGYTSLQDAISAAQDGSTVTLLQDVTEDVTINGKSIVLDLNGRKLTNNGGHTITVKIGASLTVEGSGTVDNVTHAKAAIWNEGTVVLNGGTYTRSLENGQSSEDSGGNSYYVLVNHGTMTVNGGVNVTQNGHFSSLLENGYYSYNSGNSSSGYVSGVNAANPTLTINGGMFNGGLNTVKNDDGATLTINDGTFTNVTQAALLNWNVTSINGGTFTSNADCILNGGGNDTINKGDLVIKGGTFDAGEGCAAIAAMNGNADYLKPENIQVSGGKFSSDVEDFVVAGMEQDENGSIVIDTETAVASVNGVGYISLDTAIAAAKTGDTIVLLQNISSASPITVPAGVTLDGGNHSITCTADIANGAFLNAGGSNVTIRNVTVNTDGHVKHGVQFYCVEGGKLSGVTVNGGRYTSVVINGSTNIMLENCTLNPDDGSYANVEYGMGSGVTTIPSVTVNNVTGDSDKALLYADQTTLDRIKGVLGGGADNQDAIDKVKDSVTNTGSSSVTIDLPGSGDITVDPPYQGGGSSVTTYSVTVESVSNGTVAVSPKSASKNSTVTITVTPDSGYALSTLAVTDKDGKSVELTKVNDTKYTFKMPASKVTVKAAFAKTSTLPFTDVAADVWYYDAVAYVYEKGMMTGTNDGTTFSPAMNLTRGMMAQVLYNLEKGTAGTAGTFTDVAADAWYADAVNWAAANGIVGGYGNGTFGPEDSITREQMAVLLYNYAKFKGNDMTATTDLASFSDDEQVSDWAEYAMQWAVAEGLIQGSNNSLNPLGTASRAEVAQVLMNYFNK